MKFNIMMKTKFKSLNDCLMNVLLLSTNKFLKLNTTLMIKYYVLKLAEWYMIINRNTTSIITKHEQK